MKRILFVIIIALTIGISQTLFTKVTNVTIKAHELGAKHYKLSMVEWFIENDLECFIKLNWTEIDSIFEIKVSEYQKEINTIR